MIYVTVIILMISLYVVYQIVSVGLKGNIREENSEEISEIERIIVGILTHEKATDPIKIATKLLVQEYENISAMENRLLLMVQDDENKLGLQENLAHSNVQKKMKKMETRFMQLLLWLQTDEMTKVEAVCADVLVRHQAVKKAHSSIKMPRGH